MMKRELTEELLRHAESDYYPFHMPGHKRNLPPEIDYLSQVGCFDITEIDNTDNLHDPTGVIRNSQNNCAKVYGADEAYYLVNGSTAGILTALSAAVSFGGKVLVARNCHRAVYHGMYLRHLNPVYLQPSILRSEATGGRIAGPVLPEKVEEAVRENPDIEACLITSPSYDGVISDIRAISEILHKRNIPLIVDCAHGAHLGFSKEFPGNPISLGADLVIMSTHKTLPALTQTAILVRKGTRVPPDKIRRFESIYQTSSPSYVLMSSIESAVMLMGDQGRQLLDCFADSLDRMYAELERLKCLEVLSTKAVQALGRERFDRGKLLIGTGKSTLTGQDLYDILREEFHLQLEMSAEDYVTAILTPWDREEGICRLTNALKEIDLRLQNKCTANDVSEKMVILEDTRCINHSRYPLWQALEMKHYSQPLDLAAGKAAGGFVNLYPPGIPILVPGEEISDSVVRELISYAEAGMHLQGVERNSKGVWELPVL